VSEFQGQQFVISVSDGDSISGSRKNSGSQSKTSNPKPDCPSGSHQDTVPGPNKTAFEGKDGRPLQMELALTAPAPPPGRMSRSDCQPPPR